MAVDIAHAYQDPAYRTQVCAWVRDHGHNPDDIALDVKVDSDGTVHLTRFLRNAHGRTYVQPGTFDPAVERVVIEHPKRPFPIPEQQNGGSA